MKGDTMSETDTAIEDVLREIPGMSRPMRLSIAITSVVSRIARHGTTMDTHQVIDMMGAALECHRLASALDFMENVILTNGRAGKELGSAAIGLTVIHMDMVKAFNSAALQAQNLLEMAIQSEPKQ